MRRSAYQGRVLRTLALCASLLALPAAAEAQLPDLVADPPARIAAAPETYSDDVGPRLLLRFDGYVHNRGPGALEIRGSDGVNGVMGSTWQHVYGPGPDGGDYAGPQLLFETNDSHNHWHMMRAARYSLWNSERTAEVAPAMKAGFCLIDSSRVEAPLESMATYTEASSDRCGTRNRDPASLTMGISAGWRDYYGRDLAFQWVDVSDVPPGSYWVQTEVDPDGVIRESDEVNPPASRPAEVPGHLARDVSQAAAQTPIQVPLAATSFGVTSDPEFKIVEAPRHGRLDRPVGEWFSGSVRYDPSPGSTGDDSFRFVARDPSSGFPLNPPAAVAMLGNGGPIEISGAPAELRTGTSAQLSAVLRNGASAVTWSVDGTPGGNAGVGTISAGGLYQAPAGVPPAGQVRVRAQSATGASGEVVMRIVAAPAPRPASGLPGPVPVSRGANPLSPLRVARHGRKLLVSLRSRVAGRVIVRARRSGSLVGRCSTRLPAKKRMTCAISLPRKVASVAFYCRIARTARLALPGMKISATLYVKGRKRAVRRIQLRR